MNEDRLDKLRTLLRAVNIAICVIAILCLLLLLFFVGFYVPLALTLVLPLFVFAAFIAFEIEKSGSLARHAIVFVLVLATVGAGFAYTTNVMGSLVPKPRGKVMMQK